MNRNSSHYQWIRLFFIPLAGFYSILYSCIAPVHNFEAYVPPPEPDYQNTDSWVALPEKKDSADVLLPGSTNYDGQTDSKVDVFYIHPTIPFSGKGWNGNIHNQKLNKYLEKYPIRIQASAFNGSCKVYAPHYRQATLYSFTQRGKINGEKALDLAYEDIKHAFKFYLEHYNHGRPFILASHSQGSRHAYLLLNDFFENNTALQKQLVAAYLIGFRTDSIFEFIPRCESPTQTGCILSWNTYKWGAISTNEYLGPNYYCTNPLSWKCDSVYCGKELNIGSTPRSFKRYDVNVSDAKIENGLLWIHKPEKAGYFRIGKNFHMSDYNLFYSNIRENVQSRIDAYFAKNRQ